MKAWEGVVSSAKYVKGNPDCDEQEVPVGVYVILSVDAELTALRKEKEKVIALGTAFGFSSSPEYSIEQVITHAEYIQLERSRLLFENAALRARLTLAEKVVEAAKFYVHNPQESDEDIWDQNELWVGLVDALSAYGKEEG